MDDGTRPRAILRFQRRLSRRSLRSAAAENFASLLTLRMWIKFYGQSSFERRKERLVLALALPPGDAPPGRGPRSCARCASSWLRRPSEEETNVEGAPSDCNA